MRFFLFVLAIFFAVYGLDLLLLSTCNRRWWARPWVRRLFFGLAPAALLLNVLWAWGVSSGSPGLILAGAGLFATLFLYLAGLGLALLCTSPVRLAEKLHDRLRSAWRPTYSPGRRRFLRRSLAAAPVLASAGITHGIFSSRGPARLPQILLSCPNLPSSLAGLKVLQLSDIHLGPYVGLDDLELLLERAASLEPDLVLVTGDVCDHLPVYGDTLRLIEQLRPPLGTFACLGNHEYFRGLRAVRGYFDRSTIPLLVDQGLFLGGQGLYIAGADDPRFLNTPQSYQALRRSVEKALDQAPGDAFSLLMSHRSQALDYAAPLGADLVLAGHTHGFQVGFGGRSLFESLMPERYIWGHYQKGTTRLYTTSGVGHWFPFRFGCPPEAPLFTLHPA
jgi:predicted MPP superfamily phosphohydrolase